MMDTGRLFTEAGVDEACTCTYWDSGVLLE